MSTKYQKRITIAVPEGYRADANSLALILGESDADVSTFDNVNFEDGSGNRYAVASTAATDSLVTRVGQALEAPAHAPNANIQSAKKAQALISINSGAAATNRIAVIVGDKDDNAGEHITALGLSRIQVD